jgi:hypothetical protein
MKLESIAQLSTVWPELSKLEAKAAVDVIEEAINRGNAEWEIKLATEKDLVKTLQTSKTELEQAKVASEARANDLQAQINQLKTAAAAAEAAQKFQTRMATLDEQFDLDDEDRALISQDGIKEMNDEAFAAYVKKQGKLMAGKKKGAKAQMPPEMVKKMEEKKEEKKEECKASVTEPEIKQALASVTPIAGEPVLPNAVTAPKSDDLVAQMDEAFGDTIKVGGKTVRERRAEKKAAQPKED